MLPSALPVLQLVTVLGPVATPCSPDLPALHSVPQLIPLLQLQHPHISVYEELFQMWDSEVGQEGRQSPRGLQDQAEGPLAVTPALATLSGRMLSQVPC